MKLRRQKWLGLILAIGVTASAVATLTGSPAPTTALCVDLAGLGVMLCVAVFLVLKDPAQIRTDDEPADTLDSAGERDRAAAELEELSSRLDARERDLTMRFHQMQELFEYPLAEPVRTSDVDVQIRLSEKDAIVQKILDAEAERVYEKIRANGYVVADRVDHESIQLEIADLIRRVAQVYSPDSKQPLLETSFEQLARAASRLCLHSLVLMERFPLDVKRYNINDLYSYVRKAVVGYGVYQQASPWLNHLSRGAYLGRFAAGSNPVTLGAWWLATEAGKRGMKSLVERTIDRTAIAALQDIVATVGVEVANIYGKGFRQRDAAWILGSELTNVISRFPVSREILREGLRQITGLPLKNEYDRIYLYRCVAEHRSAEFRLSDPAILSRESREHIVAQVEAFFLNFVHGTKESDVNEWKSDLENRFDLKLKLGESRAAVNLTQNAVSAAVSIYRFLTSVCGVSAREAVNHIERTKVFQKIGPVERVELIRSLPTHKESQFEPPDLDPTSGITTEYLADLITSAVRSGGIHENTEPLLIEVGCYFRRSRDEVRNLMDQTWMEQFRVRQTADARIQRLDANIAKRCLFLVEADEKIAAVYEDVQVHPSQASIPRDVFVTCLYNAASGAHRAILVCLLAEPAAIWSSNESVQLSRKHGMLIDDCRIRGGLWQASVTADSVINIGGTVRGGGFENWFAPVLALGPLEGQTASTDSDES